MTDENLHWYIRHGANYDYYHLVNVIESRVDPNPHFDDVWARVRFLDGGDVRSLYGRKQDLVPITPLEYLARCADDKPFKLLKIVLR